MKTCPSLPGPSQWKENTHRSVALVIILLLSGCAYPHGYPDSSGISYRPGRTIAAHVPVAGTPWAPPPAPSTPPQSDRPLNSYRKYKHTHTDHLDNKYKTTIEMFPSGKIRTKTKFKRSERSRTRERVQRWLNSR